MAITPLADNELMMPDADSVTTSTLFDRVGVVRESKKAKAYSSHCRVIIQQRDFVKDGNLHFSARGPDSGLGSATEWCSLIQHHCVSIVSN